MNFDHVVIGSGLAGMACALRLLDAGRSVAMISSGSSSLHFSSGSMDLLCRLPDGTPVDHPLNGIHAIQQRFPRHPYASVPAETILESMSYIRKILAGQGLNFTCRDSQQNHLRLTALGTLRATWLSPETACSMDLQAPGRGFKRIALVTLAGCRDLQPELAAATLGDNPQFTDVTLQTIELDLPALSHLPRNACELRSADLASVISDPATFDALCQALKSQARGADVVMLPAIFYSQQQVTELAARTGLRIGEVPTMPPSLPGMRIEQALIEAFVARDGVLFKGDVALRGAFSGNRLQAVYSENLGPMPVHGRQFLLASGSFFSRGLSAHHDRICEPVFNLDIEAPARRSDWYQQAFLGEPPHAFISSGVRVNRDFNPAIDGRIISNLFCAGAVTAGYNPVYEGSGSGVAISSGYHIAGRMLSQEMLSEESV